MNGRRTWKRAWLLAWALWFAVSSGWGMQRISAAGPEGPESPELPPASEPQEAQYVFDGMIPADAYYFDQVMDVATDSSGNVYAAEQFGHRIVKLSAGGEIVAEWQGDDSFAPEAIAVDNDGYVFAAGGEFIYKLDMDDSSIEGSWEIEGLNATGLAVDSASGIVYVADWDSGIRVLDTAKDIVDGWTTFYDSSEIEQAFEYPYDVAVDGEGDVYVADQRNRIVKLNGHGAYLEHLDGEEWFNYLVSIAVDAEGNIYATDSNRNAVFVFDPSFEVVTIVEGEGRGAGQFDSPQGIAVSDGSVYVADTANRRIQKLDADTLASEAVWGTFGTEEGQFYIPEGIAVDGEGHIYVADQGNERIQLFDRQLQFVASRDGGESYFSPYGMAVDAEGRLYMTSGSLLLRYDPGSDEVEVLNSSNLSDPMGVAVDASGYIYVANTARHQIAKLDSSGALVLTMEGVRDPNSFYFRPTSIAVDSDREIVYSADSVNIQTFDTRGVQLEESWGEPEGGEFGYISGIAVDEAGNVFVADRVNSRIQKFNSDGKLLAGWGSPGTGKGEFYDLASIAVDRAGNVYVTETGNHRLQKVAPATHTISFVSNDGTEVEAQTVSHGAAATEPAAPTRAGYTFRGWYVDSELTEAYTFETPVTADMTLYAKWSAIVTATPPPRGDDSPPSGNEPEAPAQGDEGLTINGEPGRAVVTRATDAAGRSTATISIDWNESNQALLGNGQDAVLSIHDEDSDVLTAELEAGLLTALIERGGRMELRTAFAAYVIEADRINLTEALKQLGPEVREKDAIVRIVVARSTRDVVQRLMDRAETDGFEVIAPPVHFTIEVSAGGATREVSSFNGYVERTIVIPSGVNPSRMTTGVVIGSDGSVRHAPTRLVESGGVNAGAINSLTNSDYALIGRQASFKDMGKHWAQNTVENMGSRLIAFGVGEAAFAPDRSVTRAEFAAFLIRSLGLAPDQADGRSAFPDIDAGDWHAGTIGAAHAYGLIGGFEDGTFRPNDQVTREQAMSMIANAMRLTGLPTQAAGDPLSGYADGESASDWAKNALNVGLEAGILAGINGDKLAPKSAVTRAQAATLVHRLLEKSGLI